MIERAKDLGRLEQALRPPKARGGFGELLLENLLRDRLPPEAYAMQHTFATGDRVDAVIRADRLVPVDSKFPLDNFELMVAAEDDDAAPAAREGFRPRREGAHRRDRGEVHPPGRRHVRLRAHVPPGRGDLLRARLGQDGRTSSRTRTSERVFPVSATTFTAYLQVIVMGLKGLQIEQTRTRGHGVLRRAAEGLRQVPGGLRARRHAPVTGAEQVRGGGQAARPLRDEARPRRRPRGRSRSAEPPALPRALDAA